MVGASMVGAKKNFSHSRIANFVKNNYIKVEI